jgi:hypothetical protein
MGRLVRGKLDEGEMSMGLFVLAAIIAFAGMMSLVTHAMRNPDSPPFPPQRPAQEVRPADRP